MMRQVQCYELECPCCGDTGAISDERGLFHDGQKTACGCIGSVSCDSETEPWLNIEGQCEGGGAPRVPVDEGWPEWRWDPKANEYVCVERGGAE